MASAGRGWQHLSGLPRSFLVEIGLVLRDWRYVARIANIDVTQLTGVSAANLINLLVRACIVLPTAPSGATAIQSSDTPAVRANMGRTVIYCNRVVRTYPTFKQ